MEGSCTLVRCMLIVEYLFFASSVVMGIRRVSSCPCEGKEWDSVTVSTRLFNREQNTFFMTFIRLMVLKHKTQLTFLKLIAFVLSCGGSTRTNDLQVMSLASYQLLHSAMCFLFLCAKVVLFHRMAKQITDYFCKKANVAGISCRMFLVLQRW